MIVDIVIFVNHGYVETLRFSFLSWPRCGYSLIRFGYKNAWLGFRTDHHHHPSSSWWETQLHTFTLLPVEAIWPVPVVYRESLYSAVWAACSHCWKQCSSLLSCEDGRSWRTPETWVHALRPTCGEARSAVGTDHSLNELCRQLIFFRCLRTFADIENVICFCQTLFVAVY